MLARLFLLIGGFVVLVLLAALIGPYFINWTSYRADFEREVSAILGRPVKVNGQATARLLPFPSVTFTDVTVAGAEGEASTTVEQFSMDAELAPFLSGEVLIFDMRLVRPKILIRLSADGEVDWAANPSAPVKASQIALERMTVTDGEVRVVSESGAPDRLLTEINAVVSARSLAGPWRVDGALRADGRPLQLSVSTGVVGPDGMRLKVRAEPDAVPFTVDMEGNARSAHGVLSFAGNFRVAERRSTGADLRGNDGKPVIAANADPGNRASGTFTLNDKRLAVEEFRFETGPLDDPYTADGTASVEFGAAPSFAIKATGAQWRIGDEPGAQQSSLTLADRLASIEKAMLAVPKPPLPGALDIDLPAIVAGETMIRDVRLSARTAEQGWQIDSFSATLPGRTSLEMSGALGQANTLDFNGKMVLAVGQPSGFAGWLAKDIDEPIRRLPRAGFAATVNLSRDEQLFRDVELALGGARFKGTVQRTAKDGARPVLAVALEGGAVTAQEAAAAASLFLSGEGQSRFADHDVHLNAKAGPVGSAPVSAQGVDLAMRLLGDTVEIDRLNVSDLAGASLAATGQIVDPAGSAKSKLDMTLIAPDLAPLVSLGAGLWPDNRALGVLNRNAQAFPKLLADTRFDLLVSGEANGDAGATLTIDAKGNTGGTDLTGKIAATGSRQSLLDANLSIEAKFANPDGAVLMALAGLPSLPLGLAGAADVAISAAGTPASGLESSVSIKATDASALFSGVVTMPADGLQVRGKTQLTATDIEPWLMTAGVVLPGMGAGAEATLTADADYANGLLALDELTGTFAEQAFSGDLSIEVGKETPKISGALVADELALEPLARMVLGNETFDTETQGWPDKPFEQAATTPFKADVEIKAATLSAGSALTVYDAALTLKLDDDGLRVPKLTARFPDGTLSGLFELKNSDATGLFGGQFKLTGARIKSVLSQIGVRNASIDGAVELSAGLSGSGRSVGAIIASLAGSGTASLKDVSIPGINPAALPLLIKAADAIGRDIDAARVAQFAPPIIGSGTFPAGDADIAFTLAGGVLRAPPIIFDRGAAKLSGDLKLDLNTLAVSSSGSIAYAPGEDALVGSEPSANFAVSGPLGQLAVDVDIQPLAQFLTQRALEIEQARVEQMQAVLLEKQRLRREARYYAALEAERVRTAEQKRLAEEAARQVVEEQRLKAEEEAKAVEEQRRKAEEEAKVKELERAKAEAEKLNRTAPAAAGEAAPPPAPVRPKPVAKPSPKPRPSPAVAPAPTEQKPAGNFPPPPTLPDNTAAPSGAAGSLQ